MSNEHYYCDSKYDKDVADTLNKLERKVHFKLYMLWTLNPTLPLTDIANAMGVSRQAFRKYIRESNPLTPDIYKLLRLSRTFNIPIHYFTDDNIDYMDTPQNCTIPDSYVEDVNKELIPFLINSHLAIEQKAANEQLRQLLHEAGLEQGLVCRLTDNAFSNLANTLKGVVDTFLSDKNNINEPVNPIDPDDFE